MDRQVLECGDGVCEVAALGLERARGWRIAGLGGTEAKAVTSLRSSPHSKTLTRGSPLLSVHSPDALNFVPGRRSQSLLTSAPTVKGLKWKALYAQAIRRRACYLVKQTPAQALLLEDDLAASFAKVKEAIPDALHPAIAGFISAPSGWNDAAAGLAQHEWELVKPLFDGLKREKFNLGKATLEFYGEREPSLLTDDERDYLKRLSETSRSEAQDEDQLEATRLAVPTQRGRL